MKTSVYYLNALDIFAVRVMYSIISICFFIRLQKLLTEFKNTLDTNVKSTVRNTISAGRYMDKIREVDPHGHGHDLPGTSLCIVRFGEKTIVGGHGKMFDDFIQTKQLVGLFRPEDSFLSASHPKYEESNLQVLRFDQTFKKLPYDASHRKFESHLIHIHVTCFIQITERCMHSALITFI